MKYSIKTVDYRGLVPDVTDNTRYTEYLVASNGYIVGTRNPSSKDGKWFNDFPNHKWKEIAGHVKGRVVDKRELPKDDTFIEFL